MNLNISFSSFQETGQTGTKHLLNMVRSRDNTTLNKQDDQVTILPLKFDHTVFGALPKHFWAWIPLILKIHEYGC